MRTLPEDAAGGAGVVTDELGAPARDRVARCLMGPLVVAGDRWAPSRASRGVVGALDEALAGGAVVDNDELVNGVAGGSRGDDSETAGEPAVGGPISRSWLVDDPAGACSVTLVMTEACRPVGGVVGATDASTFVGGVSGSPSPALRVGAGLERTVRPGPASGDRWAAGAFGVAVGAGVIDAGVASGCRSDADSGSGAAERGLEDGEGVSSSIRPAGAAPSEMAERWGIGTTVIAARG